MSTIFIESVQGTSDMAVFRCNVCGNRWVSNKILDCDRPHTISPQKPTTKPAGEAPPPPLNGIKD